MGKVYNNRLPKWQLYEQWQDPLLAMVDIGGVVVDVLWLKNISVQQQTQKGKPKITLGGKKKKMGPFALELSALTPVNCGIVVMF